MILSPFHAEMDLSYVEFWTVELAIVSFRDSRLIDWAVNDVEPG